MTRPPRPLAALSAALALAGSAGCAGVQAGRARTRALEAALDATRLERPLEDVWPEVLRLLIAGGFPLGGAEGEAAEQPPMFMESIFSRARETSVDGAGRRQLDTHWGPGHVRYHVEGQPTKGGGCRVRFFVSGESLTEHNHDAETRRDSEMELALLSRLDPEAAERLRASLPPPLP